MLAARGSASNKLIKIDEQLLSSMEATSTKEAIK